MSATVEPTLFDFVNGGSRIGRAISETPEQLEDSLSQVVDVQYDFNKVCVCGMGASAIAGDIFADFANETSSMPINVVRGVMLPRWVDSDTLTLITSYSGNTWETLELYKQALARGCPMVSVTSGGELRRLGQRDGVPTFTVPNGIQPRAALGHILGLTANTLESLGVCPSRTELLRIIPELKELRDSMMPNSGDNEAISLAESLYGTVPVIYGHPNMAASALRWKTQINENSKMLAFSGIMPEFNHNEIVGWVEGSPNMRCSPVVLYDANAPDTLKRIIDATVDSLRDSGVEVHEVQVEGDGSLEKNLRSSIIGDFVSLYLAFLRKVDPEPVASIVSLKQRLGLSLRH